MTDPNEPYYFEPSDDERSQWPDATSRYVQALEQHRDKLEAALRGLEGEGFAIVPVDAEAVDRFLCAFDPEYETEDMPYQAEAHARFHRAMIAASEGEG